MSGTSRTGSPESKSTEALDVVEAGPFSAVVLREIGDRLLKIQRLLGELVPEGIAEPLEPISVVSDTIVTIHPLKANWFSMSLINDGPNDVFVLTRRPGWEDEGIRETWHRVLNTHETYNLDVKRAKINEVLLKCNVGQAALVRVVGVR